MEIFFITQASILFLKALRRKLENNNVLTLIIFLIDEQRDFLVGKYSCV
ncbi:hypothetical protein KGQ29_03495 [Patescibacteria group bacterium]|nr:hypothetical protein [Patescibacteria group bacterium]